MCAQHIHIFIPIPDPDLYIKGTPTFTEDNNMYISWLPRKPQSEKAIEWPAPESTGAILITSTTLIT